MKTLLSLLLFTATLHVARAADLVILSPTDWQVAQRHTKAAGTLVLRGDAPHDTTVEWRVTGETPPGALYEKFLTQLIRDSRRETGWDAPWFVALASYHVPGDEASPDLRAAQAALWKSGVALEGPDSDALTGEWRERGGKGVHFSGKGLREHAARWFEKLAPWLEKQLASPNAR